MTRAVLLDAGPLGLVTNPKRSPQSTACAQWLQSLVADGVRVFVPEIADYEVRRELIRAGKSRGLSRLDALANSLGYLPITTTAMRHAAELWARVRQQGRPTADDSALDADVILAAQALSLAEPDCIVATTNVGHLTRMVNAARWTEIAAE
ncbi:MAG: PIN domain-containing protein [Planctomycetaceae bacterium]